MLGRVTCRACICACATVEALPNWQTCATGREQAQQAQQARQVQQVPCKPSEANAAINLPTLPATARIVFLRTLRCFRCCLGAIGSRGSHMLLSCQLLSFGRCRTCHSQSLCCLTLRMQAKVIRLIPIHRRANRDRKHKAMARTNSEAPAPQALSPRMIPRLLAARSALQMPAQSKGHRNLRRRRVGRVHLCAACP